MYFYALDIRLQKFSSRVIMIAMFFIVLVLQSSYTADLASIFFRNKMIGNYLTISEVKNEMGLTLYSFDEYVVNDLLKKADYKGTF